LTTILWVTIIEIIYIFHTVTNSVGYCSFVIPFAAAVVPMPIADALVLVVGIFCY
jgi:uncharacterized membrane protein